MEKKNYHTTITVHAPAKEVLKKISQVNHWWAKDFSGKAEKLNDQFTIRFGDTFVDFKISELVPDKKVAWKVVDSFLPWLKDKKEWNNTEVIYNISSSGDTTKINFTHVGLVPGIECYERCEQGWTRFVTLSLPELIDKGKGRPE